MAAYRWSGGERVDHRSYARQGVEMEPTVKIGHASARIERRAERGRRGAARRLQTNTGDGFEAVPALDHSPRREQTPGIEMKQPGQVERDRLREQEQERQRELDGPDIGFGR